MKRLLLTLIAGFCFSGLAMAQDGAKIVKQKAINKQAATAAKSDYAARVKAKEEKARAMDAGKAVPSAANKASKARLAAEKAD